MRRLLTLSASAAVLVAFAPGLRAADEPKDIVAKAIKAHGGEAVLKLPAGQIRTKGKITLPGVGEVAFTQDASYMLPDKFKDSMDLEIAGQKVSVLTLVNGDKVTVEANGKAVDAGDKVKDAMKDVGHMMKVARLVVLKEKGYELSLIGEDKVGEKKVIGVRVSMKGQKDVSMYFDKETGLLAKLEHRTNDPTTGNEIAEERIIAEYEKDKDGVPMPKKVVIKHDGKTFLEAEVLEAKFLEKLDDSEFKK